MTCNMKDRVMLTMGDCHTRNGSAEEKDRHMACDPYRF